MTTTTRRSLFGLAAGAAASSAFAAGVSGPGKITENQFHCWLDLRGGLDGPAYWYSDGLVRPISGAGQPTSRMLGVETWVTPAELRTRTKAVSLSRKIFFLLDLDKDEIAKDAAGKPTRPSIYIHQLRTFTLVNGTIKYEVESHNLQVVTQGGANSVYTVTEIADQAHVNYGSYPARAGADGQMRVTTGEIYDYWDNGPRVKEMPARYQMSWVAANLEGRISSMHGWRYATFDDIPNAWLKNIVKTKAPEWTAPPMTLAEIEKLRATIPYRVPGLGL